MVDLVILSEEKENFKSQFLNVKVEIVSNHIARYLSDSVSNDGVMAIVNIVNSCDIDYAKCLILDNIQDPSNLGAIIRSARAFGYNTIFSINYVYPYTFKAIRSSMGYVFDINIIDIDINHLLELKKLHNLTIISADMDGVSLDNVDKLSSNYAIVIGNEGQGISNEILNNSDLTVSIPMLNGVESLNASVSASILMYNLK